ncbi:MAG: methionyl-tRNA formyltransferase [candidate division Zixibacteria bacterium]|nr:methionyl-tRNA formyltransferase [candidate division Zixibacteria bacterium]MDD5426121.1 methionyl-tRNA formyltransferase [candidate division Zixibacteria bacterium]
MRLVYMGTPEFARPPLVCLCQSKHELLAVVTGRDKKAGRGQMLLPTPCRQEAEKHGLSVLTPDSLDDEQLFRELEALKPDLFVVAAFRVLPEKLFALPRLGSINIHASLLPRYRGAAPINWALINGDKETGLTSFFLKKKVDCGEIILQEKVPIYDEDNFDSLYERLSKLAGPFLLKTLEVIEQGACQPLLQDNVLATRAPKITPFDALIDFGFPAERVRNFIRGLSTRPGAYSFFRGLKIKIFAAAVAPYPENGQLRPGTVLPVRKKLVLQCDNSAVEILRLLPEGKKEMDGLSFINGFKPKPGEVFGEIEKNSEKQK